MRLSEEEVRAIRESVHALDPEAEIILYGSRAVREGRGGDIDLLVITDRMGLRELLRLRRAILDRIGWQQLDVAVRRRDELNEPLAALACATGVRL